MNEDWTKLEVELIVQDYFNMLQYELEGKKYNKTFHRQGLIPLLSNDRKDRLSLSIKT